MSQERFPEEFKIEAVRQIVERGHPVAEVSTRLGVSSHSLYKWIKEQQMPTDQPQEQLSQTEELRRLKAELKRVTAERVLCQAVRLRYAFIERHEKAHGVRRVCTVMDVHPSGDSAWKTQPTTDQRQGAR